jgi:hypothetical protein
MSASVSQQIAVRHFGDTAMRVLTRRGIRVLGLTSIPSPVLGFLDATTAYKVDDRGTGRVWTFQQVREAAQ